MAAALRAFCNYRSIIPCSGAESCAIKWPQAESVAFWWTASSDGRPLHRPNLHRASLRHMALGADILISVQAAKEYNTHLQGGANIAGFLKVAEAMLAQGVY